MHFKFGSDPEFFLFRNDQVKSAIGLLPSKKNYWKKNGNKFYYDNILAEIAIRPGRNLSEVLKNTRRAMKELSALIFPAEFKILSAEYIPDCELQDREALITGCKPEYDVYNLQIIAPPADVIAKTSFRTAGGHIHLGINQKNPYEFFDMIRMMDLFVGIPSLFLDTDESSKLRKKIYGKSGSHRLPDHGLEYRVLSNFWLASPKHLSLIYNLTQFTLNFVKEKLHRKFWSFDRSLLKEKDPSCAFECFGYELEFLRDCLDNYDFDSAEKFMLFISNYLPEKLLKEIDDLAFKPLPDPYEEWEIRA